MTRAREKVIRCFWPLDLARWCAVLPVHERAAAGRHRQPRLADGGAEQVPDAVGEGQAERSADDQPQDGAADAAAAQVGAEGTGQTESDQDDGKSDRYPQRGREQQDRQQREQGTGGKRQRRRGGGLDRAGDVGGSMCSSASRWAARAPWLVSSVATVRAVAADRPLASYRAVSSVSSASGLAASSPFSCLICARSLSRWLETDTYSPSAIDTAPATSPARPAVKMGPRAEVPPATPMTMPATDTTPSLAPSTPARNQFNRPAVPPVCGSRG
jgi:hypothetical protein